MRNANLTYIVIKMTPNSSSTSTLSSALSIFSSFRLPTQDVVTFTSTQWLWKKTLCPRPSVFPCLPFTAFSNIFMTVSFMSRFRPLDRWTRKRAAINMAATFYGVTYSRAIIYATLLSILQ